MTPTARKQARRFAAVAAAVFVLSLLVLQLSGEIRGAGRALGYYVEEVDGRLVVAEVIPGLPAEVAGLQSGDVILRISSQAIHDEFDYDVAAAAFSRGRVVDLEIQRGPKSLTIEAVPGTSWDWRIWASNAFAACLHIGLAALVLRSNVQTRRARLLSILLVAIAVELALPIDAIGQPIVLVVAMCTFWLLNGLQFGAELHLASLIPGEHSWFARRPWMKTAYYVLGLGFGLMWATRQIPGLEQTATIGWLSSPVGEWVSEGWALVWPVGVVAILVYAAVTWDRPLGRQQALLILLGLLPWAALSVMESFWILAGIDFPYWAEVVEPLALVLYPIAIVTALFRYQLFDFEFVVRKSLVYTALTTGLLLVFYAALGASGAFLSTLVEDPTRSVWVVGGATLVLGLLFSPLRTLLEAEIERRFFPERATLRRKLGDLSADLPKLGEPQAICDEVVSRITTVFAVEWCRILLREGDSGLLVDQAESRKAGHEVSGTPYLLSDHDPFVQELRAVGRTVSPESWRSQSRMAERFSEDGAKVVLPILANGELLGVLLLGGKLGGEAYPPEEIELLSMFAHHLATVMENARLFESATIDGLTRLLRREAAFGHLFKEAERALRYGRPLAVGLVDIDNFKLVNDRDGHLMGDLVLQQVASGLRESVRRTDLLGRFGGDEFVIVLPETPLEGARQVGESLRSAIENLVIEDGAGRSVSVTVSVGMACLPEGTAAETDPEILIAQADNCLYLAKAGGKNCVRAQGLETFQQRATG